MNAKIISFALLAMGSLSGETAGKVTYNLPDPSSWKLSLDQSREDLVNRIYIPKDQEKGTAQEYFAVVATDRKELSGKLEDMKAGIEANLPGYAVEVRMISENPNDVTYEWKASKENSVLSGITKGFNTRPGVVLLTYQRFGEVAPKTRALWIEQLKQAKAD